MGYGLWHTRQAVAHQDPMGYGLWHTRQAVAYRRAPAKALHTDGITWAADVPPTPRCLEQVRDPCPCPCPRTLGRTCARAHLWF